MEWSKLIPKKINWWKINLDENIIPESNPSLPLFSIMNMDNLEMFELSFL